ncbi:MAG: four helix bundle protein [Planctomycetota bacterium]
MAMAEEFEDLIAWQKARELNRGIYAITRRGEFARDFALRDQIRRAAISVMSNIAEGFDRRSRAEFRQFLGIAKASCAEVRAQLYIALDAGYVDQTEFDLFKELAMEVSRVVGGLMASLS